MEKTNLEWLVEGGYVEAYDDPKGCKLVIKGQSGKLKELKNVNPWDVCKWLLQEHKEDKIENNDEKAILKVLSKEYNWIARNACGSITVSEEKPQKDEHGVWCVIYPAKISGIPAFDDLFKFIKWMDDEPYNIRELLQLYK